jgi:hypothetical protein
MNTPTLMQSEEKIAPWNQKFKKISVDICQCLSTTVDIEVPEDFEDYDNKELLEDFVREQIILPSEVILEHSPDCWYVDELCINV